MPVLELNCLPLSSALKLNTVPIHYTFRIPSHHSLLSAMGTRRKSFRPRRDRDETFVALEM